ncbi:MAG: ATP synthase F0 subunit B [Deltaproteobacteria bacterium]|nr:ATP synthase F0 subunit B [Deltaproteobacteria bacterium]
MDKSGIKRPGMGRKRSLIKSRTFIVVIMLLLFLFSGVAAASGGGEGESKGWLATDTYKVMNFAVLAIGLFILLRKPVSQALNDRIKGIKEQLSELEEKKEAAEKKLAEYNEKFLKLDKEAEQIVAEYVKQGNEARARILKEAESAALKLEDQAKKNIANEFEKAKSKLHEEILEQALVKAEDIIQNKITSKDQDKLVDEYLEKVVA